MKKFFAFDIENSIEQASNASLHELLILETKLNTDAGRRATIYFMSLDTLKSTQFISESLDDIFNRFAYKGYISYNNIDNFCNSVVPFIALSKRFHKNGDGLKGFYLDFALLNFLSEAIDRIHPSENELTNLIEEILNQILESAMAAANDIIQLVCSQCLPITSADAMRQAEENLQIMRIVKYCFSDNPKTALQDLAGELEVADELDNNLTPFIQAEIILNNRLHNDKEVFELINQNISMPLIRSFQLHTIREAGNIDLLKLELRQAINQNQDSKKMCIFSLLRQWREELLALCQNHQDKDEAKIIVEELLIEHGYQTIHLSALMQLYPESEHDKILNGLCNKVNVNSCSGKQFLADILCHLYRIPQLTEMLIKSDDFEFMMKYDHLMKGKDKLDILDFYKSKVAYFTRNLGAYNAYQNICGLLNRLIILGDNIFVKEQILTMRIEHSRKSSLMSGLNSVASNLKE